jgi:hypothetical protein
MLFRPALFSSRGGEVFNEAESCNIPVKSPRKKFQESPYRKRPLRWPSAFDRFKVTATGSVDYPHVRQNPRKSRLRVQPNKHNKCTIQSLYQKTNPRKSRLRVQPDTHNKCTATKSLLKDKSMQKSPKGATGQSQHTRISHLIQQHRTGKRRVTGHITQQ